MISLQTSSEPITISDKNINRLSLACVRFIGAMLLS
jgi:hypothetical protein